MPTPLGHSEHSAAEAQPLTHNGRALCQESGKDGILGLEKARAIARRKNALILQVHDYIIASPLTNGQIYDSRLRETVDGLQLKIQVPDK